VYKASLESRYRKLQRPCVLDQNFIDLPAPLVPQLATFPPADATSGCTRTCPSTAMIRFDGLPPEVMQAMCTPMHQILSQTMLPSSSSQPPTMSGALYLGSLAAVMDPSMLRSHNITHIIQVLDVPWNPLSDKDGFNLYKIEIMDEKTVDIRPYLEGASSHIERALRSGRNVLVHCQQVSLVLAVLGIMLRASSCNVSSARFVPSILPFPCLRICFFSTFPFHPFPTRQPGC